jgi:LmbE family N-acetylglucosaminyl deacetylase
MLNPQYDRALVLAPHTDDGELGAGGTIARLVASKTRVTYVAFSSADESLAPNWPPDTLRREVAAATAQLGIAPTDLFVLDYKVRHLHERRQEILEYLIELRDELAPQLVLMPSATDLHQDHEVVAKEGLRAFKHTTILSYEIPWNHLDFRASGFVELSSDDLDKKIRAMECYESQKHRSYVNAEYLRAQARFRGVQAGATFAEVFDVVRWIY